MSGGLFTNPRCNDCGRFATLANGASSAMQFDFVAMEPSYDHLRCASCTAKLGPVRSNARPSNGDMTPYQTVTLIPLQHHREGQS
jgi:hypothetical protein